MTDVLLLNGFTHFFKKEKYYFYSSVSETLEISRINSFIK